MGRYVGERVLARNRSQIFLHGEGCQRQAQSHETHHVSRCRAEEKIIFGSMVVCGGAGTASVAWYSQADSASVFGTSASIQDDWRRHTSGRSGLYGRGMPRAFFGPWAPPSPLLSISQQFSQLGAARPPQRNDPNLYSKRWGHLHAGCGIRSFANVGGRFTERMLANWTQHINMSRQRSVD